MKRINKIKYKTCEYISLPLEFSEMEDEFKLNEKTGQLEKVGVINCQEIIQSNEDVALNKILDKYMPETIMQIANQQKVEVDPNIVHEHFKPDLSDLGAEYERLELLKEKYDLPDSMSYDKVLESLKNKKTSLENDILKIVNKSKGKEETDNEKKTNE